MSKSQYQILPLVVDPLSPSDRNTKNFSMLFLPLQKNILMKMAYISQGYYHAAFEVCNLSGDRITPTTELRASASFITDCRKLKGQDVGMASSSAKRTRGFG